MGIFDIIGPVMVGPSSSHTAGAARIGQTARAILGEPVKEARITLYGSFAKPAKAMAPIGLWQQALWAIRRTAAPFAML